MGIEAEALEVKRRNLTLYIWRIDARQGSRAPSRYIASATQLHRHTVIATLWPGCQRGHHWWTYRGTGGYMLREPRTNVIDGFNTCDWLCTSLIERRQSCDDGLVMNIGRSVPYGYAACALTGAGSHAVHPINTRQDPGRRKCWFEVLVLLD